MLLNRTESRCRGCYVQLWPPAPSESPPSRFQSPAIRKVDPSDVSVMAVQCFESSAFALGTSARAAREYPANASGQTLRSLGVERRAILKAKSSHFAHLHPIDARWQSFILPNRCAAAPARSSRWPMRTKKKPPRLRSRSRLRGRGQKNSQSPQTAEPAGVEIVLGPSLIVAAEEATPFEKPWKK